MRTATIATSCAFAGTQRNETGGRQREGRCGFLRRTTAWTTRRGRALSGLTWASSDSDLSDESLQKALEFQQKQSHLKSEAQPIAMTNAGPERKVGSGSKESLQVQEDLGKRLGKLADEQMTEAIQRQVGATPADWTEEDETKDAPAAAAAEEEEASGSETPEAASKEKTTESPPGKYAPAKRFPDGSVMYTAEQFKKE